ncbi:MAG: hypothetical protein M3487_11475 [Actinomycetota bacterium]|nr:hypothetical protein [Actinomycetota bacterium]
MTTAEQAPAPEQAVPSRPARWSVGRRRPPSPAARVDLGRVAEAHHRNPAWLLGGILLVVMSALGGVLLFASRDDRVEVLVTAGELRMGDVVERQDLRIERIAVDGGLAVVEPDSVDEIIGQYVVAGVPDGTLVNRAMFSPESGLGANEMDVGAALDPGEFPQSDLPVGARVELLVTVPAGPVLGPAIEQGDAGGEQAGGQGASAAIARSIGTGVVTQSEERANGQLLVTLRVSTDVGLRVTQAATEDTLRVVLVGGEP